MPGLITKSNLLKPEFADGTGGTINPDYTAAIDDRTSTFYSLQKSDDSEGHLFFEFPTPVSASFFALAGATFDDPDAQYRVQYRDPTNSFWVDISLNGWQDINQRNFILATFDLASSTRWHISFRRVSQIDAGFYLMHLGEFQVLPRVSAPHDIINLIEAKEIETGANKKAWTGARLKTKVRAYPLQIRNYSVDEMDAVVSGIKDYITAFPFFYQFDSVNYPDLVALLVTDGAPGLPRYSSIIRRDWTINTEVLL